MARLDFRRLRRKLFFPESLQCGTESHHHVSASPELEDYRPIFLLYGNMDCYHANDTGRVAGVSISGSRLNVRVIKPDGMSCMFSGRNLEQTINGGYICYEGGVLIEQGSWRAPRSY
jgi:hypothetical protein